MTIHSRRMATLSVLVCAPIVLVLAGCEVRAGGKAGVSSRSGTGASGQRASGGSEPATDDESGTSSAAAERAGVRADDGASEALKDSGSSSRHAVSAGDGASGAQGSAGLKDSGSSSRFTPAAGAEADDEAEQDADTEQDETVGSHDDTATEAAIDCAGKETVVRDGVRIEQGDGTAVRARGTCKVRLRRCTLVAAVAIDVAGSAQVDASQCTITGTQAAIIARGSATVRLEDSEVDGDVQRVGKATVER